MQQALCAKKRVPTSDSCIFLLHFTPSFSRELHSAWTGGVARHPPITVTSLNKIPSLPQSHEDQPHNQRQHHHERSHHRGGDWHDPRQQERLSLICLLELACARTRAERRVVAVDRVSPASPFLGLSNKRLVFCILVCVLECDERRLYRGVRSGFGPSLL